jgi:hypothetical protein
VPLSYYALTILALFFRVWRVRAYGNSRKFQFARNYMISNEERYKIVTGRYSDTGSYRALFGYASMQG